MDEGLAPLQGNEGCVEGAVKGGRSPAKRTLEGPLNADTLQGLGLVADFRSLPPSPSGGEDFPALGGSSMFIRPNRDPGSSSSSVHSPKWRALSSATSVSHPSMNSSPVSSKA